MRRQSIKKEREKSWNPAPLLLSLKLVPCARMRLELCVGLMP